MTTAIGKRPGTRPGTKFTEEHKRNLVEARKNNPRWDAGRKKAARKLKGRKPAPHTVAASLASRALKRDKGLTRKQDPAAWQNYYHRFLAERLQKGEAIAA